MVTGKGKGADTKARCFLELDGAVGGGQIRKSGRRVLNPEGQSLDKGKTFTFSFESTDLGELKKLKIGHDNTGFSPNWQW